MNNKVNYTFVGVIVLIGFVLAGAFTYWIMKPTNETQEERYIIYFDESVFGLNLDAPVKFRGISVGKVTRLRINPKNSEQVEVEVSIVKTTPIKSNTVAKLVAQGITGLTYINLTLGERSNSGKMVEVDGRKYKLIASEPSFFNHVAKSLGSVSAHVTATLLQTEKLLNDKNQENLARFLRSSANSMEKIDRMLDDKTLRHMQSTIANIDSMTKRLDETMKSVDTLVENTTGWEDDIADAMHSIAVSYEKIDASMVEFKKAIMRGDFNLKEITADIIPNLNNTFLELEGLIGEMEDFLEEYERSPSDMLFKTEEYKKAPGE